ncbi:MAG: 16S rRNA (cytidine(1402)-2'-O)-methyltransferase [Ruminococcus sp.]|nr:16S rRNA (cytidine(1402)-2'-O)-methyltransferase [Ruminococcus sp.]MBR2304486.1 16S rRNA (cytidine(1402)-2'-O)-methyltransferase [Ruminococcus sp.]
MGTLYVVGTPIGNLGDMTYRAVETLEKVDFICAEDTRVTAKLLNYFEIKKPLVSYHEHNAKVMGEKIAERLRSGEDCAIVTDAGMPCISDPGEQIVMLCRAEGIDVKVVPGPSAVVSALAVSGLPTARFRFEGFLSVTKKQRLEHLASVRDAHETLIFYEAPHKLMNTLKDMLEYFGDRRISLCRELTKIHEEVKLTTLSEAIEYYTANKPKGEFVLVIEGADSAETDKPETIEEALEQVRELVEKGMRGADACRNIAKATGFSKGELYSKLLEDSE